MQGKVTNFLGIFAMIAVEFLKIGRELLKKMSAFDLRRDDYLHIELYEDARRRRED